MQLEMQSQNRSQQNEIRPDADCAADWHGRDSVWTGLHGAEMTTWRSYENDRIDMDAADAIVEIKKQTLRAYCWLNGIASHHIRSLAQLRRDRVSERFNKQQGIRK